MPSSKSVSKTALVTGASGYIAKYIVQQLLDTGWNVVGSVRSAEKAEQIMKTMQQCTQTPETLEKQLSFVELDLTDDAGWDAALQGVDALVHTASPFPMAYPNSEDDLIRPAVDGVLRALNAAKKSGVKRIFMTSSSVAIIATDLPTGQHIYTEEHWTDINHSTATPYIKSKTLAEQVAWDFVSINPEIELTCINPTFVQGPPLDTDFGTSVNVIARILSAKDSALPDLFMPTVDVRDIALMHVKALSTPGSIGKRIAGVDQGLSFQDFALILKQAFPDRKIVTRVAPHWLMKVMALFDKDIKGIIPQLGNRHEVSNALAREILEIEFRDARQAIRETAKYLKENHIIE